MRVSTGKICGYEALARWDDPKMGMLSPSQFIVPLEDDFGSGYSSLTNLLEYDFDVLKMDLEFLRTYDRHPKTGELIRYIVRAAQSLGAQPLQEGVETKEHFDFLKAIGCERAQGYYFSKPLPMSESRIITEDKGIEWEGARYTDPQ